MKPVSPVIPGLEYAEIVIAKDQPEYQPLPALMVDDGLGTRLTRWELTWRERLQLLFKGSIYVWIMTFGYPVQPLLLQTRIGKQELVRKGVSDGDES